MEAGDPLITRGTSRAHKLDLLPGCTDPETSLGACEVVEEEREIQKDAQIRVQQQYRKQRSL